MWNQFDMKVLKPRTLNINIALKTENRHTHTYVDMEYAIFGIKKSQRERVAKESALDSQLLLQQNPSNTSLKIHIPHYLSLSLCVCVC